MLVASWIVSVSLAGAANPAPRAAPVDSAHHCRISVATHLPHNLRGPHLVALAFNTSIYRCEPTFEDDTALPEPEGVRSWPGWSRVEVTGWLDPSEAETKYGAWATGGAIELHTTRLQPHRYRVANCRVSFGERRPADVPAHSIIAFVLDQRIYDCDGVFGAPAFKVEGIQRWQRIARAERVALLTPAEARGEYGSWATGGAVVMRSGKKR